MTSEMRRNIFLLSLCAITFVWLTLWANAGGYLPGEEQLLAFIVAHRHPANDAIMLAFSAIGSINVILPLWFIALVSFAFRRQWFWLARFLPIPLGYPVYLLIKTWVARPAPNPTIVSRLYDFSLGYWLEGILTQRIEQIPPQGVNIPGTAQPVTTQTVAQVIESGYPSGHALLAALLYATIALWCWKNAPGNFRWVGVSVLIGLALLAGAARVYIGVHFPSDVLASWLLAIILLACARVFAERVAPWLDRLIKW